MTYGSSEPVFEATVLLAVSCDRRADHAARSIL
jgi:hypothetical protein